MLDRQFKAIAFRGEGKDIEAHVVDCVLAEDCAALIQRAREEERERAWKIADEWVRRAEINWAPEDHWKFKNAIYGHDRAAGLREGEKP